MEVGSLGLPVSADDFLPLFLWTGWLFFEGFFSRAMILTKELHAEGV